MTRLTPIIALIAMAFVLPAGCSRPPDATVDAGADLSAPLPDLLMTAQVGPWDDPPAAAPPDGGTWRNSLAQCWTDPTCHRAMVVSHGGDWDQNMAPYDSRAALVRAVQRGADGIKGDFRTTADNIGVVAHSSPIELFESPKCVGKFIEKMTAAEVNACHLLGTPQTYQRVDDLLHWAHGRAVVMLDVKLAKDLPRAITTGIEAGAQDDLFLEVHIQDFLNIVVKSPGWEQIHYLVWLGNPDDADKLIQAGHSQQGFMYEMDPTYPNYDAAAMKLFINTKLHPAGIRAFTSSDKLSPTIQNHQALFDEGFDVVMTYDLTNALNVRQMVNTGRGISPP